MIRAMLVMFALAVLLAAWIDRPKPVNHHPAEYCVITYRAAGKDEAGVVHFGWASGWGLCRDMDRYETT